MRPNMVLALIAPGLLFASGCASLNIGSSSSSSSSQDPAAAGGPELVGQARPPIPDVPVPTGFDLDEGHSRNFTAAGTRYIDHVYRGSSDKFSVSRFYKRQMPINRWTLVTDMFVQGEIMLDFEKNMERCRVTVTDGGLFRGTLVKVALWTSGRIVPPTGAGGKALGNS